MTRKISQSSAISQQSGVAVSDLMDPSNGQSQCRSGRLPKVMVIASLTSSLVNFRFDLLKEMAKRADVLACAPDDDPETQARLSEIGVEFLRVPMDRTGTSPAKDVQTLLGLVRAMRSYSPDTVFAYTMKPIIYGGLAARMAGVKQFLPMCTGLGYVFVDLEHKLHKRILKAGAVRLYRHALKRVPEVLVYNQDDAAEFRSKRLVGPETKVTIVHGSGVNLSNFPSSPPPKGPPVFLMVARLLRDKGVFDYVEAARQLRAIHPEIRCQLLGPLDANPASVQPQDLEMWRSEGIVEYLGETNDVSPYLAACSVFVLPSYREGLSRTVLEAMATGRAIVTSDAPGCPDPVVESVTGFVTPVRSPNDLAQAMLRFVEDESLVPEMGAASRARVEDKYDVVGIVKILLGKLGLSEIALR